MVRDLDRDDGKAEKARFFVYFADVGLLENGVIKKTSLKQRIRVLILLSNTRDLLANSRFNELPCKSCLALEVIFGQQENFSMGGREFAESSQKSLPQSQRGLKFTIA